MLFSQVGQIQDNFHITGLAACPIYLLDGPNPLLFDGGISCAGQLYVEAIRSILGARQPAVLFLTHAHWDHCGSVSYLKKAFPTLKIAASQRASEILKSQNALALIKRLNKDARESVITFPEVNPSQLINDPFQPFGVDVEIEDRQILEFGKGETVEVLATPGHTRDHFSYYLPQNKILIAGEAAGEIYSSGVIVSHFLSDYEAYMSSIRRLADLPIEALCQGHHFALVGREEVRAFFDRSIIEAIRYKDRINELLGTEGGSINRVIQRLKAERYDTIQGPKQPEIPYLLNVTAQVKHLAGKRSPN